MAAEQCLIRRRGRARTEGSGLVGDPVRKRALAAVDRPPNGEEPTRARVNRIHDRIGLTEALAGVVKAFIAGMASTRATEKLLAAALAAGALADWTRAAGEHGRSSGADRPRLRDQGGA
jgi:hypothetical protein